MATQTTIAVMTYSSGVLTTCALLFLAAAAMLWTTRSEP